MPKRTPGETRLNVYEVVNYGRRESLIVLAADALPALMSRLGPPRPAPIEHWSAQEVYAVEQLSPGMPRADAEEFVKLYLSNVRWQGWTTLVWHG